VTVVIAVTPSPQVTVTITPLLTAAVAVTPSAEGAATVFPLLQPVILPAATGTILSSG
jgi:hypothetical protein